MTHVPAPADAVPTALAVPSERVGEIHDAEPSHGSDADAPHQGTLRDGRGPASSDRTDPDGCDDPHDDRDVAGSALVAALTAVLARRPARPRSPPGATSDDVANDGTDAAVADVAVANDRGRRFVSALHQAPGDLDCGTDPDGPLSASDPTVPRPRLDTAAWVAAARRRRLSETFRTAGAWVLTIGVGVAIVAATVLMLFAPTLELDAWFGFASRIL